MQTETRPRKDEGDATATTTRRENRPGRQFQAVPVREAGYGFPAAHYGSGYGNAGYGFGLSPPITAFGSAGSFGAPAPFPGIATPPTAQALLAPLNAVGPTLSYGLAGLADLLHRGVNLATVQGQALINAWQAPMAGYGSQGNAPTQVAWPNARLPAVDIVDEGSELVCQVELPGCKPENVDVACHGRGLLVTAQSEPDIDLGALVQAERGLQATYRRSILLPAEVQPSGAKARLRDGVLTINLPKVEATEGTRRIPVES